MRTILVFSVLTTMLLLSSCSKSPKDKFIESCTKADEECICVADSLEKKISDDEFEQMMDEMNKIKSEEGSQNKLGRMIFQGNLVNKKVSKALLQSAKACAS